MKLDRSFKKLANSLPFMMAYVDNKRRYQYVNRVYEEFFGVQLKNIKGSTIAEIVGDQAYQEISKLHSRVLEGEEVSFMDRVALKDGRNLQLDVKYVPNREGNSDHINGFFAIIHDVTEYATAAEVLRAVHDVVNRQSQVLSTDRINNLLQLGCHYLNAQTGIVSKVKDNNYTVQFSYSENQPIPEGTSFDLGDTYCSVTLEANQVIATSQASVSEEFSGHPCYKNFELETYLGLPVKINGQVWGTLNFTSSEPRLTPFTELDIELMGLICSAIETIITNSTKTNRLEKLAYTDFLTGLTNRLYITELYEEMQSEQESGMNISCFAIIDIDHFKSVNDKFGHDAGDEVLRQTARMISQQLRASDCVSRIGGEEFAIILTGIPAEKAHAVLEKIRTSVEHNVIQLRDNPAIQVTVSIGATILANGNEFRETYKQADKALYNSKDHGRNQVSWANQTGH